MPVNTNIYCSLDEVKDAVGVTDSEDDTRILDVVRTASRLIEAATSRIFYDTGSATARVFVASSSCLVEVDDFHTTTGLVVKTDTSFDGTFDTTWTSADYQLEPLNGRVDGLAVPYNQLRAVGGLGFPCNGLEAGVEVTAQWGFATVPDEVREACVIQSVSVMKAPDAALGVAGYGDFGPVRLRQALHPTAELLIAPYAIDRIPVA